MAHSDETSPRTVQHATLDCDEGEEEQKLKLHPHHEAQADDPKKLPLTVVILPRSCKPGDGKLLDLKTDLLTRVDSVVVEGPHSLQNNLKDIEGWIMLLPDDSLVDILRLERTFKEFLSFASPRDIFLPYKVNDPCNPGSALSRGEFFRCTEVHSLRGMIIHSSAVKSLSARHELMQSPRQIKIGGTAEPEEALQKTNSSIWEDPLHLISVSTNPDFDEDAEDEDADEGSTEHWNRHNSPHRVFFHLPVGFSDQTCLLSGVTFYTIYPNIVSFDMRYASMKKEMQKLNECATNPSNIEQYMKDLAYDNVYSIVCILIVLFFGMYALYWKYRKTKGNRSA